MTREYETEAYMCRGCGRPEDECSLNPCRAVLVERDEAEGESMSTQHTPTPSSLRGLLSPLVKLMTNSPSVETRTGAAFIIQACNVHEELVKGLDDIAKGMVPAGEMPPEGSPLEFRAGMWSWSQKRARAALVKAKVA